MPAEILLIRHAIHDVVDHMLCGRAPGIGLSPTGRAQARALGAARRGTLQAVYASPLQRTQETAACLSHEVRTCDAMIEIDFGAWTGRSFAELASDPLWQQWNSARSRARPPGGETMEDVRVRASTAIDDLAARHDGERIAVVSHGDVIKAALMGILGMNFDHWDRIEIPPVSVSRLRVGPSLRKVESMNETFAR